MVGMVATIVGGVVGAFAVLGIAFVVGMRRHSPIVRRMVRRFARSVVNPRMLARAGTPDAYASVIHHVGRTTGRHYRTPVGAHPTADGFVVALPYGTTSNWVKNVMASGFATIVTDGATYRVDRPELVPVALVAEHFPPKELRSLNRFKVDRCVRFHHVEDRTPAPPHTQRSATSVGASSGPAAQLPGEYATNPSMGER